LNAYQGIMKFLNVWGFMTNRSFALALTLLSTGVCLFPSAANAETLLNRAIVQNLRNKVELLQQKQPARAAQKSDAMIPGDALRTFQRSMAELRFNDNSLARVGEQAFFRFIPNTRTMDLRNGTVLLLVQPGQGRTRVQTPNAAAGIRGSALFVRYLPDTDVTIVGALTNSDIEISTADGSQSYTMQAGQMAYVYQGKIGVYNFDQKTFQETSPFFKDIDWSGLQAVKAEIDDAQKSLASVTGTFDTTSPVWVKLAANRNPPPTSENANATPRATQSDSGELFSGVNRPDTDLVPKPFLNPPVSSPPPSPGVPQPPVAGGTPEPPVASIPEPPSRPQPVPQPPAPSVPTRPTPTPVAPNPTPAPSLQQSPSVAPPSQPIAAPPSPPQIVTPPTTQVVTPPVQQVVTPPVHQTVTPPVPQTATPPVQTTPPVNSVPSAATPPSRPTPAPLPTTPTTAAPAVTPNVDLPVVQPPPTVTTPPATTTVAPTTSGTATPPANNRATPASSTTTR
jgi:FecR protein